MRTNRFLYALGIGCTLCACSSHDEPIGGQEEPDYSKSNKYMSVAIVTSNDGTRAIPYEANDYIDGEGTEYDVNEVAFFFFDRQGNYAYAKSFKDTEFKTDSKNLNPAVTSVATVEIELKANSVYDGVIAILNPNSKLFENGELKKLSKYALEQLYADYSDGSMLSKGEKGNFTMSNSVYIDDPTYRGGETENFTLFEAVPITSHNIYIKEKSDDELTDAEKTEREGKAIQIYVERVAAKVKVEKEPEFDTEEYEVDEKGNKFIDVKTYDESATDAETKKMRVIPVFKGIGMSVMANSAYLLKHIDNTVSYKFNSDITQFEWNDIANKRTYWESNSTLADNTKENGGGYKYTSWKTIADANPTTWSAFSKYVNPNTEDATLMSEKNSDNTTKLLVCAQLTFIEDGDTEGEAKPMDLVKFSDGYWKADYLIYHAATRVAENLEKLNVSNLNNATPEEITTAENAVKAITRDVLKNQIKLTRKNEVDGVTSNSKADMQGSYLAALSVKDKQGKYPDYLKDVTLSSNVKAELKAKIEGEIQATLDEITNRQILYWKDGMTYFYVPIRHQGFYGLTGGKDGYYLNGIVRNHLYDVEISKIWGLGTPVIDPEKPIDPERPDGAPASYMTAKINVLKWRIVKSEVTMH